MKLIDSIIILVIFAVGCACPIQNCIPPSTVVATEQNGGPVRKETLSPVKHIEWKLPLCGFLSDMGYSSFTFLVPGDKSNAAVFRFKIIDYEQIFPPIESDKNWWICITEGEIEKTPEIADSFDYGIIRIEKYLSDETNGEKGQE